MAHIYHKNQIFYFNAQDPCVVMEFGTVFRELIRRCCSKKQTLVFLCIGTDRATGDCLGPLLGEKLTDSSLPFPIHGTLQHPVHAQNLAETIRIINTEYKNPFIVAVDASLGTEEHIGYITLGVGALKPGAGVSKDLPQIGHMFITGIVNKSGKSDQLLLQTTRLQLVMQLATLISLGICSGLSDHAVIPLFDYAE